MTWLLKPREKNTIVGLDDKAAMTRIVHPQPVRQREGKRFKCPEHLNFIAEQMCAVCGHRPVQVHHLLKYRGGTRRGTGKRAGDDKVVPLCPNHHTDLHLATVRGGGASFEAKYGLEATADHYWDISPANTENDDGDD